MPRHAEDLPDTEDPISPLAARAMEWHQVMLAYQEAGFTADQAFELTRCQAQEYFSVVYEEQILNHEPDG